MPTEHRLETRKNLLAGRIKERIASIKMAVAPPGQRLPFTQQLTRRDALAFWTRHRYDPIGQKVINSWPEDRRQAMTLELDAALAQQNALNRFVGGET